jgi:hypothetical protein
MTHTLPMYALLCVLCRLLTLQLRAGTWMLLPARSLWLELVCWELSCHYMGVSGACCRCPAALTLWQLSLAQKGSWPVLFLHVSPPPQQSLQVQCNATAADGVGCWGWASLPTGEALMALFVFYECVLHGLQCFPLWEAAAAAPKNPRSSPSPAISGPYICPCPAFSHHFAVCTGHFDYAPSKPALHTSKLPSRAPPEPSAHQAAIVPPTAREGSSRPSSQRPRSITASNGERELDCRSHLYLRLHCPVYCPPWAASSCVSIV